VTQTLDVLRAAISHRWLLCGNQSVFGQSGGDNGLEITPDGHWYKLYPAVGGGTVRGAGFDEEGTWTAQLVSSVPSDPEPFELDMEIFGGGGIGAYPALASTPQAMRLNNNGVFTGNYVLDANVPVGTVRCPPSADPSRSGVCTPPPSMIPRTTCTDADATAAALGIWSRCGGTMAGAPAHDGIEFVADGSFYFLHRDPKGVLVRGAATTDIGTAQAMNWGGGNSAPCQMTTQIQTKAGANITSSAQPFDTSPRQLWLYTSPDWGDPERYTFVMP
jgi:hypothetical protein